MKFRFLSWTGYRFYGRCIWYKRMWPQEITLVSPVFLSLILIKSIKQKVISRISWKTKPGKVITYIISPTYVATELKFSPIVSNMIGIWTKHVQISDYTSNSCKPFEKEASKILTSFLFHWWKKNREWEKIKKMSPGKKDLIIHFENQIDVLKG